MQNQTNENSNTIIKRIGRTTYTIHIHFSKTSRETFSDKLLRIIKNDIANSKTL